MGTLIYGNAGFTVEFDDRTLVHVQAVIGPKLRRNEAFYFTWTNALEGIAGRTSVWIDRSIPLIFQFSDDARVHFNREWLEALSVSSNSPQGMLLIAEPAEMAGVR